MGSLTELNRMPKPAIPAPRPSALKPPPKPAAHISIDPEPNSGIHDSEKTQIYRPAAKNPHLDANSAPTARPHRESPEAVVIPKEPRVPADIAAASQRWGLERPTPASRRLQNPPARLEECATRAYTAEVVGALLNAGNEMPTKPPTTAADEDTRYGELPIEARVLAQSQTTNRGVGYEDPTRLYNFGVPEPKTEGTEPGWRSKLAEANSQPRVIIQAEPSKSHRGWWVFLGLAVTVTAAGWLYRAPVGQAVQQLRGNLARGLDAAKRGASAGQAAPAAPLVTISISVSPADARLLLDGATITNPYLVQRRADKLFHNFAADAPGFVSLQRNVQFERDLTVVLALAPEPQVTTLPRAAQGPAPVAAAVAKKGTARIKSAPATGRQAKSAGTESPKNNCNPPYTIDAAKVKSFKPECL
jgi:hypothetical protein